MTTACGDSRERSGSLFWYRASAGWEKLQEDGSRRACGGAVRPGLLNWRAGQGREHCERMDGQTEVPLAGWVVSQRGVMWAAGVRAIGEEVLFRGSRTRFRPPAGGAGHASEQWRRERALLLPGCILDGCISHNTPYLYIGHDTRHWMTAACRVLAGDSICLGIPSSCCLLPCIHGRWMSLRQSLPTILNPAAPSYPTWKSAVIDPSFLVSSHLARLSH